VPPLRQFGKTIGPGLATIRSALFLSTFAEGAQNSSPLVLELILGVFLKVRKTPRGVLRTLIIRSE
jgi:hypothetical protein